MKCKYTFDSTTIQKLKDYNDNKIYIKREDLLPLSFGGNKVRIALEYIRDMKDKKCNVIIGYGNSRSNLCRVLSNISCIEDISCYIISPSDNDGTRIETNNSFLSRTCKAKYIYCEKTNVSKTIENLIRELKSKGQKPYYINGNEFGKGNESTPVNAYFNVYNEIVDQEEQYDFHFDYIFLALGTGMTYAGLVAGQLYKHDLQRKIIGISIAREQEIATENVKNYICSYLKETNDKTILDRIHITDKYLLGGYGKYDKALKQEVKFLYKNEGIYSDLTYVGKAFYGMKKYIKENNISKKNILFIHTGSCPLFFDKIDEIFEE